MTDLVLPISGVIIAAAIWLFAFLRGKAVQKKTHAVEAAKAADATRERVDAVLPVSDPDDARDKLLARGQRRGLVRKP
jgi:hypothetical protein